MTSVCSQLFDSAHAADGHSRVKEVTFYHSYTIKDRAEYIPSGYAKQELPVTIEG